MPFLLGMFATGSSFAADVQYGLELGAGITNTKSSSQIKIVTS
jgi:hypothetical protein